MPVIIEKTKVVGKSSIEDKNGSVVESEETLATMVSNEQMANVGISLGYTKNLGNYESAKVQVSIHLPSLPETESLNTAFAFAEKWANDKMEEIVSQL